MRVQLFIVLFACLAIAYAGDFCSVKYQAQTSDQKMSQLWKEITADTTPYGWYSTLAMMGLFFEKMSTSFDTYCDDMPSGRLKYIHSVGSVVQVEFVPERLSPFTGMFQGVSNALIRISAAKEPNSKSAPHENFLPGMGIKLLRDGVPSANLVAMFGLDGVDSWNIFKYDWSHHIANPCSFALKLMAKKFAEATPFIGRMGLKTWAQYDQKGRQIEDSKIVVPFRLYFRPAADVQDLFPDTYQYEFTRQLATVPVGSALYDVYAMAQPHAEAVKIGTFKTKSQFTTSKFGDKDLFFQHNYAEDDIALHPSWKKDFEADPPEKTKFVH